MKMRYLMLALCCGLMAVSCQNNCKKIGDGTCAEGEETCCEAPCNPVVKAIMGRRSVRQYKDTPVEREKLELVAKCGINAPNAMNRQMWAVRVVTDKAFIDETTEIFRAKNPEMVERDPNFKNMYRNAPAIICVASPEGEFAKVDAGLMGENMMLAAYSLGLGTCCLGSGAMFLNSMSEMKPYVERLQLPEGYTLTYVLAIGYPDEAPEAKPRDMGKVMFIE